MLSAALCEADLLYLDLDGIAVLSNEFFSHRVTFLIKCSGCCRSEIVRLKLKICGTLICVTEIKIKSCLYTKNCIQDESHFDKAF